MFFNISNHLCQAKNSTWSAEQIAEAKVLGGDVVDLPFPKVTPTMSNDEIASIAGEVARDVFGMAKGSDNNGAMVAGEYTTTILIIAALQKLGIPCYFGQSERIAEERVEDGEVVVVHKFTFAGFRRAPDIQLV